MISEELPLSPDEIARLIQASGYNQKEAAAKVGVVETTISKWVNGVTKPDRDNVLKLREFKPRPGHHREWADYLADVDARVAAIRAGIPFSATIGEPSPIATVDPEALAANLAARLAKSDELAAGVAARMPKPATVDDLAARVPEADEVAEKVVARMSRPATADEVAEKVVARMPKLATVDEIAERVNAHADEVAKRLTRRLVPWLRITTATVAVGVAALLFLNGQHTSPLQEPIPVPRQVYTDSANIGEKPRRSIPMPSKPYSWQKVAPCDTAHGEAEKVGGCWYEGPAPCPEIAVENEGRCLVPIPGKPKQPSTVNPKP